MREAVDKVVAEAKEKEVDRYARALWDAADLAKSAGDTDAAKTLVHVADACSMYMKPEDTAEPFGPMMVFDNKSTAHLGSITDDMVATLRQFTDAATDPELRARCADVIWLVKKDYKMALVAIDAYLESAKRLHSSVHWVDPMRRIERAYRLAANINDQGRFQKVSAYAKQILAELAGEDPLYFTAHILELLAERRDGDAVAYGALAEKAALHARTKGDHHKAQKLWSIAARWQVLAKDETARGAATLEAAREHVRLADAARATGSVTNEAWHLSDAITALKRAQAPQAEIEETHKRLLEVQPKAREKMGGFAIRVPLGETPNEARAMVSGKTLVEALQALAFLSNQPRIDDLRKAVIEERNRHPLVHLFHKSYVNQEGKVVAKAPGASFTNPAEDEEAIFAAMAHHRNFAHGLIAVGIIAPARETIVLEHPIRYRELAPLTQGHPFVPPGHERAWTKILHAGLTADLETAMHYIGPQMEASIRFVLATNGAIVTAHNDAGIQEELSLGKLLEMPELVQLFGKDAVADVASLFVDRYGYNLRNRVGHGLATDDELVGAAALYAWWVGLRMIMSAIEIATPRPEPETAPAEPELDDVRVDSEADEESV